MSRMNAPEMEVVRFKEDDVVAESLGIRATPVLSLRNFGDANYGDGLIWFADNRYDVNGSGNWYTDYTDLLNAINTLAGTNGTGVYLAQDSSLATYIDLERVIQSDGGALGIGLGHDTLDGFEWNTEYDYFKTNPGDGWAIFIKQ